MSVKHCKGDLYFTTLSQPPSNVRFKTVLYILKGHLESFVSGKTDERKMFEPEVIVTLYLLDVGKRTR